MSGLQWWIREHILVMVRYVIHVTILDMFLMHIYIADYALIYIDNDDVYDDNDIDMNRQY